METFIKVMNEMLCRRNQNLASNLTKKNVITDEVVAFKFNNNEKVRKKTNSDTKNRKQFFQKI